MGTTVSKGGVIPPTFDRPIISNDQSFDRVLNAGLPVAALFWSGPGLESSLEAELNSLARTYAGKMLIVRINAADNPELARRYNLVATPMLITYRNGQELLRAERPAAGQVREHVAYLLGSGPQPKAPTAAPQPPPTAQSAPGTGRPLTVTDATFARDVMQSTLPVVVDFWAPWCGPCRMVAPVLDKLAAEYAGRLRIAKLNVDENPQTQMQFQVQGIPTMLFVKNGRIVDRVVGALPEPRIRAQVARLLQV